MCQVIICLNVLAIYEQCICLPLKLYLFILSRTNIETNDNMTLQNEIVILYI